MPWVVLAGSTVIRTHRIQVPRPGDSTLQPSDPCTLCHVDRDRAWAAAASAAWWGQEELLPPGTTSEAARQLTEGDAVQRAVATAALGMEATDPWHAPEARIEALLRVFAGDPSPAVRIVATHALSAVLARHVPRPTVRVAEVDASLPDEARRRLAEDLRTVLLGADHR